MKPQYRKVDIGQIRQRKILNGHLAIAPSIHAYSLCIEYMRKWFLDKFDPSYFKPQSIYVDGSHIFNDFRRLSKDEFLKRDNPSLTIIPQFDETYNRDMIDSNASMFGLDRYVQRSKYEDSFFKDKKRSVYLQVIPEAIQMTFQYRVRVNTRPEQLDLVKWMKAAYRVGYSCSEDVDMDFIVPYSLMMFIAKDAGFEVIDNRVKNIVGFMHYLNSNSSIVFLHKFRAVNGRDEFFIRIRNVGVYIRPGDLSKDDGNVSGQLHSNFSIDFSAMVTFPSPQYYVYFSETVHEKKEFGEMVNEFYVPVSIIDRTELFPKYNDKGWNWYLTTEYQDDPNQILKIDFTPFLTEGELGEVIKYNLSMGISPSLFLEIKIINDKNLMSGKIDWDTMQYISNDEITHKTTYIGFYVDTRYQNEILAKLHSDYGSRIK